MVPKHNRLLGWGLIALGIWALYDMLLEPLLYNLLAMLNYDLAWQVVNAIPTMVIAVALIAAGIWLLGLHPSAATAAMCRPSPAATIRSKPPIPTFL